MFVIVTVLYCPDSCTAVDTSSTDEKHLHSATGKREPSCSRRRRGEPRGKEERNMIRARLVLVFVTFMAGYPSKAQVPGFQGTVNNYSVGMNPDEGCRHASNGKPACSQWFRFKFQAFNDGTVQAPFAITHDSLNGYCAAVTFVVRDRANPPGKILGTFKSPR